MLRVYYWSVDSPLLDFDLEVGRSGLSVHTLGLGEWAIVPGLLALVASLVMIVSYAIFASGSVVLASEPEGDGSYGEVSVMEGSLVESSSAVGAQDFDTVGLSRLFTPEVLFWKEKILEWSVLYEVEPNVVATIMQIESCGNPGAVSIAGARGLFQVMPFHFDLSENMLDPDLNAKRGLLFFREQMRFTGQDVFLSFAGYNGGYAASGGGYQDWPDETRRYYYWARGIFEDAAAGRSSSERLDEWLSAGGAAGCRLAAQALGL